MAQVREECFLESARLQADLAVGLTRLLVHERRKQVGGKRVLLDIVCADLALITCGLVPVCDELLDADAVSKCDRLYPSLTNLIHALVGEVRMSVDLVEALRQYTSHELQEMVLTQGDLALQFRVHTVFAAVISAEAATYTCHNSILERFTMAHALLLIAVES